jgi:copper homeostasis protein
LAGVLLEIVASTVDDCIAAENGGANRIELCAAIGTGIQIGGTQNVFHRAFDVVPDPSRTLNELVDLGFTRVLTSGQQKTAVEGRELIRELISQADSRIEVLAGGGVRAHNVGQLVEATRCNQVHMTAFSARIDASTSDACINFGGLPGSPSGSYEQVDPDVVRRMRQTLDEIDGKA